jgi:uncharacterized protein YgbK (DUF1537 family)
LRDAHAAGADVVLCDATSNTDLAAIVKAGLSFGPPVVWVGTGGLARALAHAIAPAGTAGVRAVAPAACRLTRAGSVLIVCGSRSDVARAQVRRVVEAGADLIEVPAGVLATKDAHGDAQRFVERIESSLVTGADVVVTLPPPNGEPDEPLALRVASELGRMLAPLAGRVAGVAATGGDTATSVLRAWGATSLSLVGEVEPGIAVSIACGRHAFAVVTKAGAFGGPEALVRARSRLHTMIHEATDIA